MFLFHLLTLVFRHYRFLVLMFALMLELISQIKTKLKRYIFERISIEYRKTKTKLITPASHKRHRKSKLQVIAYSCRKARKKVRERVTIGFGLLIG